MEKAKGLAGRRYALIADDLTGATDCAAAFVRAGWSASVLLRIGQTQPTEADVIAVSTDSRHDSPERAAWKVSRACRTVARRGYSVIYKKMDSTVQGNIIAEVAAVRQTADFDAALICPANPSQGRLVEGGILSVRGLVATDIVKLFHQQGLRNETLVRSPVTRGKVTRALGMGKLIILSDASSEADLDALVLAGLGHPKRIVLAGSAGMAAVLPSRCAELSFHAIYSRLDRFDLKGGCENSSKPAGSNAVVMRFQQSCYGSTVGRFSRPTAGGASDAG